ncbi:MAG: hypothetical protein ACI81R_003431 [Bradymonadia bacterium]|jgi:hypothetical protein
MWRRTSTRICRQPTSRMKTLDLRMTLVKTRAWTMSSSLRSSREASLAFVPAHWTAASTDVAIEMRVPTVVGQTKTVLRRTAAQCSERPFVGHASALRGCSHSAPAATSQIESVRRTQSATAGGIFALNRRRATNAFLRLYALNRTFASRAFVTRTRQTRCFTTSRRTLSSGPFVVKIQTNSKGVCPA